MNKAKYKNRLRRVGSRGESGRADTVLPEARKPASAWVRPNRIRTFVRNYNGNKLSARNTFLIDPQGKVAKVYTEVKAAKHSEEILAALAELQKK